MRYHIWTEGCQMNVADSDRLGRALETLGFTSTSKPGEADLLVLNTCVVRQSAEDKALGRLNSLKPLKQANPNLIVGLMGCLVGVGGNPVLQKRFPWVDVFAGPSDPEPFLRYIQDKQAKQSAQDWREQIDQVMDEEFGVTGNHSGNVSENLPIVLGCSHACTYCVIPHKRGREISRNPSQILLEAEKLVENGAKELVLLGQIVDRYGLDRPNGMLLPELLEKISEIPGLLRIRFLTSHPNWMSDDLIRAVAQLPKVMPHIEVPIQAGDDAILTAMRRGYSNSQYRNLIGRIRELIPEVSIGTDIIVGFPGEDEKAFNQTFNLLAELKLDVAHLARYSPRPHTYSAALMIDDVPAEEKMRRFRQLEDLQKRVVAEINSKYLDQNVLVLFEGKSKLRWRGRTPTNRLVFVETDQNLLGQERSVHINWTGPWSLIGELV